jgi:hypothetical protein
MYNNLQYKIVLLDIAPWEKKNNYITYESGRRSNMEDLDKNNKYEDLNVNILCNQNVKSVYCGNYYMYVFLLYVFVIIIFFIIIYTVNKFINKNNKLKFKNQKIKNKKLKK